MLEFATIVPWLATAPAPETDLRAPSRTPAARRRRDGVLALVTSEWQSTLDIALKMGLNDSHIAHNHLNNLLKEGVVERRKERYDSIRTQAFWRLKT